MDSVNFLEKSFPFNRDLTFYEIRSILREGLKHENVLYMLEDYCFLPYAKKNGNTTVYILPYVLLKEGISIALCTSKESHKGTISPDTAISGYCIKCPHSWKIYVEETLIKRIMPK